jgi:hypothetical protein
MTATRRRFEGLAGWARTQVGRAAARPRPIPAAVLFLMKSRRSEFVFMERRLR